MGKITIIKASETCISFSHVAKTYCVEVIECLDTIIDGLFTDCGGQFNCNKPCPHDADYFVPIPIDGKIMIQTHFIDPGGSTPEATGDWIVVRLYANGCLVSENKNDCIVCRWTHGYSKPRNYQTFELSGELLRSCGAVCFHLEFQDTANDVTLCTQDFKIVECGEAVSIEGVRSTKDCWLDYYGLSETTATTSDGAQDFEYSNKIYLEGALKYFGIEASTVTAKTTQYTRFIPSKAVAPFMMRYIGFKLLSDVDHAVLQDADVYDVEESAQFTPIEDSSLFLPVLEFSEKCESSGSNNCSV